ncbi:F-box/kelch-repeat protein At3g23880-like [Salvia miltiorrhiza]|uniref:F-box/kelch-repeat protein At3g23880-like n=1 Tax=Salvia miltiorrhiza TaxID=226208 RepID=UPI0025AC8A9A|nr:F-box/kelch-repeat protein At3g23880-like [Salvia miltiorrhiza]
MVAINTRRSLHLPQELTEVILSSLPVKSLLRFRCVSKSWRSSIDSEKFIKTHLQKSSKNVSLTHHRLITSNVVDSDNPASPFLLLEDSVHIVGCCNGLVCCCIFKEGRFFLWNPATRISKKLPKMPIEKDDLPCQNYGFGWDESSGAYKVFVVLISKGWVGKVYSSNTNSWKTVECFDFCNIFGFEAHFVSGKLHWARMDEYVGRYGYVEDIAAFDLKSEEFGVMKLPCESVMWLGVNANQGCLCAVSYDERTEFGVWLMKQDSWVNVRHVVFYMPYEILPVRCGHDTEIWRVRPLIFELDDPPAQDDDELLPFQKIRASTPRHLYVESLVSLSFLAKASLRRKKQRVNVPKLP